MTLPCLPLSCSAADSGRAARDGSVRPVAVGERAWLVATDGPLWVTVEGRPEDHVLARGERLAVQEGQVLWLGAFGVEAAGWRLLPSQASGTPNRLRAPVGAVPAAGCAAPQPC